MQNEDHWIDISLDRILPTMRSLLGLCQPTKVYLGLSQTQSEVFEGGPTNRGALEAESGGPAEGDRGGGGSDAAMTRRSKFRVSLGASMML